MNESVLDTDILSEVLKGRDAKVVTHAREYVHAFGTLTTTAVTVLEVVRGYEKARRPRPLQHAMAAIRTYRVLPFDASCAEIAGRIHAELERAGRPIGVMDPMIAAVAIHHGLTLATGNTAHYAHIQRLGYPLTLINWRD